MTQIDTNKLRALHEAANSKTMHPEDVAAARFQLGNFVKGLEFLDLLAMAEDNRRLSALARANNDLARHEANGRRELQAENARIREALGDIANESSDSWARDLARQALAAPGEPS